MATIYQRLEQIIPRIQSEEFIQNKGLGNEIGFYIFDYDPRMSYWFGIMSNTLRNNSIMRVQIEES